MDWQKVWESIPEIPEIDYAAFRALPKAEQNEVRDVLIELEQLREANPLIFFRPHWKQHLFLLSNEALKAFFGGNRSGKTTAGVVDDLIQAVDRSALPEHLQPYKKWEPPFHWRIVAPDFVSTMEAVIFPKLKEWVPKGQLRGGSWDKAYDKSRRMLWFENGSWCQFLTFEQDVDKHSGAALMRVHFDEEPPEPIRNENRMRLLDHGGDELFSMTPLLGLSWMFDGIWLPWEKGTLERSTVVTVDMDDNPHLDEDTKKQALAGLSDAERKARKQGLFVHFAGRIYDVFDEKRHVIPQGPIPENVTIYAGIDPGVRHMAAIIFVYIDQDGTMVVYDELGLQGKTVAQVAQEIHLVNLKHQRIPGWYVIDPAARNKSHQTGRSDQMEYADHGIRAFAGQNSVTAGINRVTERLENDRLLVMAHCQNTIDQFKRYRWASPGRSSENDAREAPVKKDDHLMDALRYLVMARPWKPDVQQADIPRTPLEEAMYREMNGQAHKTPSWLAS